MYSLFLGIIKTFSKSAPLSHLGIEGVELEKLQVFPASPELDYEFSALYTCKFDGPFYIDKEEVDEIKFYDLGELKGEIEEEPGKFTLFFKIIG